MLTWTVNDGGRAQAGYPAMGDCLTRAIAVITAIPYAEVAETVRCVISEHGMGDTHDLDNVRQMPKDIKLPPGCDKVSDFILECFGFKRHTYLRGMPTLAKAYAKHGDCIAELYKHVVAIQDGAIHDTWDSRVCAYTKRSAWALSVWVWQPIE